jgi:hypothetical protein
MRLQRPQRRDLVYIHPTTVAHDIRRQNGCEAVRRVHSGNPAFRKEAHCFSLTSSERMGPR